MNQPPEEEHRGLRWLGDIGGAIFDGFDLLGLVFCVVRFIGHVVLVIGRLLLEILP